MFKQLVIIILLSLIGMTNLSHANNFRLDGVIAIVDEDVILESELARKLDTVKQQLAKRGTKLPSETALEKQVLERLILDSIQLQMANRAGIRINDQQLNKVMTEMAKESQLNLSQFRKNLENTGINYTLFREDLKNEMMINRVRQAQVSRRIFVSEQEINNLVELIDQQGETTQQYQLGHILIAVPETARPNEVTKARDRAHNIVKDLRKGADFAQTAIAESDGQNSLQGGDFGWKTLNQVPTLFVGAIKQLNKDGVSEPIRSASGFHILKLYDSRGEKKHIVAQTNSRHILIKPSKIISESKAQAKLRQLRTQILDGEDFAKLARMHSDDLGSGSLGGELGWNNEDVFDPAFQEQLDSMNKGEITQPFRSQFGWHIVQLLDRRQDDQTLEMKKQRAARILSGRKFDEEVENWMREIREKSYVKIIAASEETS
ncbi:MAG: peptidylprolyl isomerase SurA [Pseudomonadota bacterium]